MAMKYHEKTARYKHSTEDQNFHWRPAEIVTLTVIMSWFTLVVTDDDRLKCVTLTVIISWFTLVVTDDDRLKCVTLTVIMSWFTLVVTDDDRLKCVTLTVIISWFTPVVADDDGVFTSATNHTSVKHCSAATLHQQYNMLVNKHQH